MPINDPLSVNYKWHRFSFLVNARCGQQLAQLRRRARVRAPAGLEVLLAEDLVDGVAELLVLLGDGELQRLAAGEDVLALGRELVVEERVQVLRRCFFAGDATVCAFRELPEQRIQPVHGL